MHQRTDLAGGLVNGHDRLLVELIQPTDTPPIVAINWPAKDNHVHPSQLPGCSRGDHTIIAESASALARIKAHGK